jgi:hypothetical protein
VFYVAAPVHEKTSVFITVGGRLPFHSVLQMNFLNFIYTFIQSLMRTVGGLPHINTLLLCLIRVVYVLTESNYRCACHSGLCCRHFVSRCVASRVTTGTSSFGIKIKLMLRGRSRWLCLLNRGSAAACLLVLWVRTPPGTWKFVSCDCCVLTDRGFC